MKKTHSMKERARFDKNSNPLSRALVMILFGAITTLLSVTLLPIGGNSTKGVSASTNPTTPQGTNKRYKATSPIVVDRQTGRLRMPTREETDELVQTLSTLAKRPEGLPQTSAASGAVAIDLDGGFGGVMLARPNGDGTFETKCVFTFEEGAEFLGLVEDNSQQ